jgi:hypothetical protein
VRFVAGCDAEEVFAESVNPRGSGLSGVLVACVDIGFGMMGLVVNSAGFEFSE